MESWGLSLMYKESILFRLYDWDSRFSLPQARADKIRKKNNIAMLLKTRQKPLWKEN